MALLRVRDGEQTLATLLAVAFGTQFPDLVDKPLAWTFGILPSGRSFAHSVLVATIIIGVVYWVARRHHRQDVAFAFGVGTLSHSIVDLGPAVIWGLLQGDWSQLEWTTYLLWPILSAPPYPNDESFLQHFADLAIDPYMVFQFVLLGVAIIVWVKSGSPGVTTLRRVVQERVGRREIVKKAD